MNQKFSVSGSDLAHWRTQTRRSTQFHQIPLGEVDWLLREISNLTALELRLESFADQPEITLSMSLAELEQRWQRRLQDRSPPALYRKLIPFPLESKRRPEVGSHPTATTKHF